MKSALFTVALLLMVSPARADFSEQLRRDAQAMHDDIAANHPGPVNPLDAGFVKRNDDGLADALARADKAADFSGYWFAMTAYAASFDDGHLSINPTATPVSPSWPGFLTGFDPYGDQRLVTKEADIDVPLNARLQSCDGVSSGDLAAANVGAFWGRWFLPSMRVRRGGELFVDRGNPYILKPSRCVFEYGNATREVVLAWRPIDSKALDERLTASSQIVRPPIAARRLWNGTRWFSISSFNGSPSSEASQQLPKLIAAMKADRASIAAAPAIVLDLRGNGGGSSDWSRQIAQVLWGHKRVASVDKPGVHVEWRVSESNIASLVATRDDMKKGNAPSREVMQWLDSAIKGMSDARARGESLWREPPDADSSVLKMPDDAPALAGPVFFITDSGCGSACLDAADLFRAVGAIQIGQQTSADTNYMDIRSVPLPSALARLSVPMKVVRGRERGSNAPLDPVHRYPGDLRDTESLERWVTTLPEANKASSRHYSSMPRSY